MGKSSPRIIVACGGTGGHLFPGLAVAEELLALGCQVTALISSKKVDQEGIKTAPHVQVETVAAVGFSRGQRFACLKGLCQTFLALNTKFSLEPPHAALSMGGFTSVAPVLAARRLGACAFLHESNAFPGRANRWLSRVVDQAFIGFPETARNLKSAKIIQTGTPVRARFSPQDANVCRAALGLDPKRPVLLILGGSQGARGVNRAVIRCLPVLRKTFPALQFLHLAGDADFQEVQAAYQADRVPGVVKPFFDKMELALGAASLALSRSGASTLAELAAMGLPAVLIPYPKATDNHQHLNALAYENSGGARVVSEESTSPERLSGVVTEILGDEPLRAKMASAISQWHRPTAAREIAASMVSVIQQKFALSREVENRPRWLDKTDRLSLVDRGYTQKRREGFSPIPRVNA